MGVVARSPYFRSFQTEPMSTVLIAANGNPIEFFNCIADTGNLHAGLLVYITASSFANHITEAPADFGDISTEGFPGIIEIVQAHKNLAGNYNKTETFPDNTGGITVLRLYKGMDIWVQGGTLTAAISELLVHAASGLVTNTGDPDGAAIDQASYAYRALTALSAGTHIPVRVEDRQTFDKSA